MCQLLGNKVKIEEGIHPRCGPRTMDGGTGTTSNWWWSKAESFLRLASGGFSGDGHREISNQRLEGVGDNIILENISNVSSVSFCLFRCLDFGSLHQPYHPLVLINDYLLKYVCHLS